MYISLALKINHQTHYDGCGDHDDRYDGGDDDDLVQNPRLCLLL